MTLNLEPVEVDMNPLQRNFTLLVICLIGVMIFLGVLSVTLANHLAAG